MVTACFDTSLYYAIVYFSAITLARLFRASHFGLTLLPRAASVTQKMPATYDATVTTLTLTHWVYA